MFLVSSSPCLLVCQPPGLLVLIEYLAHLAGKGLRRERLLEKRNFFFQQSVSDDGVVGVTGHVKYFDVRRQGAQMLGKDRPLITGMTRSVTNISDGSRMFFAQCNASVGLAASRTS